MPTRHHRSWSPLVAAVGCALAAMACGSSVALPPDGTPSSASGGAKGTTTSAAAGGTGGAGASSTSSTSTTLSTGAGGCGGESVDCSGVCADLATDPANCGACGEACPPGRVCAFGSCVCECAAGLVACGPLCCVDLTSDPTNCGACGAACPAGDACVAGICTSPGCAAGAPCPQNEVCTAGVCACAAGFGDCDGDPANGCEASLVTDPKNCGACGLACLSAGACGSTCAGGACTVIECTPGFADCDCDPANGCERDLTTDVANCGACGHVCSVANGTPACSQGVCVVASCDPGFGDCDGDALTGCETSLDTVTDCGACGKPCSVANGTAACSAGMCRVASCKPGFADCDQIYGNGCEVSTAKDADNCGLCGLVCANPSCGGCVNGVCLLCNCSPGYADCNGSPADGCEVRLTTDPKNCGVCGMECAAGHDCQGGLCI